MVYFDWLFGYGYGSDLRDKLKGDPEVYQTLKRVVRGTLADPSWQPQSLPAADDISSRSGQMKPFQIFLLCHLLISAVDADEHEDVLQLLAELEGELDSIEAQSWFVKAQFVPAYEKSRSVAYRQFNDELMRLQPLTAKRTVEVELSEEIHAVYIELLTKCRPEAKRYLKTWKDISGMEVQFQKGEWVDIPFDDEVDTFFKIGNWTLVDSQTLVGDSRKGRKSLQLQSKCFFPGPIEIAMDVGSDARNGMIIGIQRGHFDQGPAYWANFGARLRGGRADTVVPYRRHGYIGMPAPNQLSLACWGPEHCEFRVNDLLTPGTSLPEMRENANTVGISNTFGVAERGHVTIKNLRVRKLTKEMPPPEEDSRATAEYYTKAIQEKPKRRDYYLFRGIAFYHLERYAEAEADLEYALSDFLGRPHEYAAQFFIGKAYDKQGKKKQAEETALKMFREAPSPGNGAVIYYATAAMSNLIDNLLSGDDPSSENIKRANDVANKLVKKYRSWQSHTARASAQVVARDFEGAAKSIALAKAKIQTEEQEEILAKLETEMKELQKKGKAAQPKP